MTMRPQGSVAPVFCARARYSTPILAAYCLACATALCLPAKAAEAPAGAEALESRDPSRRLEAAETARYGRRGAPSGAQLDAAAAREPNPQVRYRLLQALAARDGAAALPALSRALASDPAPIVRVAAAQELGRYGEPQAARALSRALARDESVEVRRAAASSLAVHRSTEAAAALLSAADNPDAGVRALAGLGLSRRPKGRERDRALDRLEKDADAGVAGRVKAWRREGDKAGRRAPR